MKKWDGTNSSSIPQVLSECSILDLFIFTMYSYIVYVQELQQLIQQQKAACDAMTDEKDKLINDFQQVHSLCTIAYTYIHTYT